MGYLMREPVLLVSGARATTQTLGPYTNPDDAGDIDAFEVILDLTAFVTAASLTLSIEEWVASDNVGGGAYRTVLAGVALVATGQSRLRIGMTYPDVANLSRADHIGSRYRVVVTAGNANSHTYSVSVQKLYNRN